MSRTGLDPAALRRYVERVQPPDRQRSPYPARAERIAALQQAIRELPPASYSESGEFQAIQELAQSLLPSPLQRRTAPPTLYRKSDPAR